MGSFRLQFWMAVMCGVICLTMLVPKVLSGGNHHKHSHGETDEALDDEESASGVSITVVIGACAGGGGVVILACCALAMAKG